MKLREITDIKLTDIKLPMRVSMPINPRLVSDILFRKEKRTELFLELSVARRVELLRSLTVSVRRDVLMRVPEKDLAEIIETVDQDEATDMLQIIARKKRDRVLQLLDPSLSESISALLEFDSETAAGLMTLDFIQVGMHDNIMTVASKFRRHEKKTGRPPVILVANAERKLVGFLPSHEIGFVRKSDSISKSIKRITSVKYSTDRNDVISLFKSHPNSKVAVLSGKGEAMGVIHSDDMLRLVKEEEASSLYDFAGISDEEGVSDTARNKVKKRHRWLIINLGTAFLASSVIGQFEDTLSTYVLLAAYLPIVAGLGGNSAMQAFGVVVRGIAFKQIELKTAWRTLKNELLAGAMNGLFIGSIIAGIAMIRTGDPRIALVMFFAMVSNLLVASFFGTMTPLVLHRLGHDPATSASIFITFATDGLGFLVFLSLATVVLL